MFPCLDSISKVQKPKYKTLIDNLMHLSGFKKNNVVADQKALWLNAQKYPRPYFKEEILSMSLSQFMKEYERFMTTKQSDRFFLTNLINFSSLLQRIDNSFNCYPCVKYPASDIYCFQYSLQKDIWKSKKPGMINKLIKAIETCHYNDVFKFYKAFLDYFCEIDQINNVSSYKLFVCTNQGISTRNKKGIQPILSRNFENNFVLFLALTIPNGITIGRFLYTKIAFVSINPMLPPHEHGAFKTVTDMFWHELLIHPGNERLDYVLKNPKYVENLKKIYFQFLKDGMEQYVGFLAFLTYELGDYKYQRLEMLYSYDLTNFLSKKIPTQEFFDYCFRKNIVIQATNGQFILNENF
jgi:hypothetical protein